MPKTLGICERLKAARENLFPGRGGITRLSEQTGIGTGRLSEYERFTEPSAEKLAILVKALGCSALWLLTGDGEMFAREGVAPATVEILATAAAADPNGWIPRAEGHERRTIKLPASAHLVQVSGDSMAPTAMHRQFVWVVDEPPKDGGLAVIENDGELMIKRVYFEDGGKEVTAMSVNQDPHFRPIKLHAKGLRLKRVVGTWWY